MAITSGNIPTTKLLHDLLELVFDAIERDEEALSAEYEELELDRDQIVSNIMGRLEALRFEQRKAAALTKREQLYQSISEFRRNVSGLNKSQLLAELRKLLDPAAGSPAMAYFHKLESMDENDLRNILNELDITKMMEEKFS